MSAESNPRCGELIEVAKQLMDHLPDRDVRSAFLFGSPAWGDADEASDIDIMLLLDRPVGYREVTRVRIPDLIGHFLPHGPLFADLDRISADGFAEIVAKRGWGPRVARSVILRDTDRFYESIRDRVSAEYDTLQAREGRFLKKRERADVQRGSAQQTLGEDPMLAALHARLGIEEAGAALIELNDDRLSVTHFVESLEWALSVLGRLDLFEPFLRALSLDAPSEYAERNVRAYNAFAEALKRWVEEPEISGRLSQEDLAWAAFAYGEQSSEEIQHKVATFTRLGRIPTLLYYLDGQLMVPIRISVSRIFSLRSRGIAERMPLADFQVTLREEPELYEHWVSALRLDPSQERTREADELTGELLRVGEATLASKAAPTTG